MTPERALEINDKLVAAYLFEIGITDDLPDLDDVTPAEAIEAASIAAQMPGRECADGTTTFHLKFDHSGTVMGAYAHAVLHKPRSPRSGTVKS